MVDLLEMEKTSFHLRNGHGIITFGLTNAATPTTNPHAKGLESALDFIDSVTFKDYFFYRRLLCFSSRKQVSAWLKYIP